MTLKNIYTYGGEPAQRLLTVADFIGLRGTRKFTSTVPNTFEEAQACAEAGIVNPGDKKGHGNGRMI